MVLADRVDDVLEVLDDHVQVARATAPRQLDIKATARDLGAGEPSEDGRPGVRQWELCIRVTDTGPGFAEGLVDQLIKPITTRKRHGTGLGLWICRGIVERYGGDITAANRPEGGAVLCVTLLCEPG